MVKTTIRWPKTTMMMKKYLEDTKRYKVDIARTKYTWQGDQLLEKYPLNDGVQREALKQAKPDPDFKPDFSKYQVVISNFGFGAAKWPEETNAAFDKFVAGGGGLVIVHAADNSFGDWQQYNEMIGLGGWGNRNEKSGPYTSIWTIRARRLSTLAWKWWQSWIAARICNCDSR